MERHRARQAVCPGCGHDRADAWVTDDLDDDEVRRRDRRYYAQRIECAACGKADRARGRDAKDAGRHTVLRDREAERGDDD